MDWTNTEIHDHPDTTVASLTTFDNPQDASPSIVIAMAIAELEDTPPSKTEFTLTDEIDPDALDDIVTDDAHNVTVEFTVDDYIIVAQSNGMVQIRTIEEGDQSTPS